MHMNVILLKVSVIIFTSTQQDKTAIAKLIRNSFKKTMHIYKIVSFGIKILPSLFSHCYCCCKIKKSLLMTHSNTNCCYDRNKSNCDVN